MAGRSALFRAFRWAIHRGESLRASLRARALHELTGVKESQRALLRRRGLHLSRDLGQNFLTEGQTAERLVAAAGVRRGDSVIEVGVGLGALTRALTEQGALVVGIEIDSGLVQALREEEGLLPADNQESGAQAPLASSDWLIRRSPNDGPCSSGQVVRAIRF